MQWIYKWTTRALQFYQNPPVSLSGQKSQLWSYQKCPISSTLPAGQAQTHKAHSSRQCQHSHQEHTWQSCTASEHCLVKHGFWQASSLFCSLNPLTRAPSPSVKARLRGAAADLKAATCPWLLLQTDAPWALTEPHLSWHHHQQAAPCSTTAHRLWAFLVNPSLLYRATPTTCKVLCNTCWVQERQKNLTGMVVGFFVVFFVGWLGFFWVIVTDYKRRKNQIKAFLRRHVSFNNFRALELSSFQNRKDCIFRKQGSTNWHAWKSKLRLKVSD